MGGVALLGLLLPRLDGGRGAHAAAHLPPRRRAAPPPRHAAQRALRLQRAASPDARSLHGWRCEQVVPFAVALSVDPVREHFTAGYFGELADSLGGRPLRAFFSAGSVASLVRLGRSVAVVDACRGGPHQAPSSRCSDSTTRRRVATRPRHTRLRDHNARHRLRPNHSTRHTPSLGLAAPPAAPCPLRLLCSLAPPAPSRRSSPRRERRSPSRRWSTRALAAPPCRTRRRPPTTPPPRRHTPSLAPRRAQSRGSVPAWCGG